MFYSTCYRREEVLTVIGVPTPAVTAPVASAEWYFGDQCVSCADAAANAQLASEAVPTWRVAEECKRCS